MQVLLLLEEGLEYLCRINVEEWHKMQIYVYVPPEKFRIFFFKILQNLVSSSFIVIQTKALPVTDINSYLMIYIATLKWKCPYYDEILITGCNGISASNENFIELTTFPFQWWKPWIPSIGEGRLVVIIYTGNGAFILAVYLSSTKPYGSFFE